MPHFVVLSFCLVSTLSAGARRLHDTGRSGWWQLLNLTIIGAIPVLIWECSSGTKGPNRYGPPPS